MTKRRNLDLSNAGSYFDSTGKLNLIAGTNVSISSTDSSFTISATDTNTTYTNVSEFTNDANYLDSTTVLTVPSLVTLDSAQTLTNKTIVDATFSNSFTIGSQVFYEQGTNGFSVNEDYDPSNNSSQTAYHFTSGSGRSELAFTLARTSQFTNGFGIYGTSSDNTFVTFGEQGNTNWEWRTGIGIQPLDLDGGILRMKLSKTGALTINNEYTLPESDGSTGYYLRTDGVGNVSWQPAGTIDSAFVTELPVSTFTNDANYLDSTTVTDVINASYIQANQTKYNTSNFVDSAYVSTQINNLIGSAPGTLDTLEEIANALNNDSQAYASLVKLINGMADSDWVQSLPVSTFTNDANYLDSTTVTGVVNSSYIQNNQIKYNTADFPDSAGVIALISANETTYTNVSEFTNDANYLDSTTVQGVINAAYVEARVPNSFGYVFVSGQTTVSADSPSDILTLTGNNGIRLVTDAGGNQVEILFVNDAHYLDSTTVQGVVNAAYVQARQTTYNTSDFLDSTTVSLVVDASYVQARQTTYSTADFLDSVYAIALIDSAYIEARRPAETIFGVVNNGASAYTFTGDGFPSTSDNPTLYLARGKTYKFGVNASGHPFQIRVSSGGSAYSDGVTNNGAQVGDVIFTVPMNAPNSLVYQCTVHSGMVGNIVIFDENSFLDSTSVTGVINSAYIQARQITYNTSDFTDSAFVTGLPVSTFTNDANYLDSTTVQGVINASYIQANQTTYSTADFLDSYYATALIDSAYIQLRQAGGTDPIFKSIAVAGQDSIVADGTSDILTVAAGTGISITTNASTDTLTITATGGGGSGTLDSTTVLEVIDAHLNQSNPTDGYVLSWTSGDYAWVAQSGGGGTVATGLSVDNYKYTATSGQTSFTGNDITGNSLSYISDRIQVFRNGVLLTDSDDYTATNGTSVVLASGADSNDAIVISAFKGVSSLDSAGIISLIAANETTYTNVSEFVNDANYLDSTTVQGVINASYIQANQTTYNTSDFLDSTTVTGVINASYIQSNQTTYNTSDFLDSTTVTGVINASYIQSNQTTYSTADFLDSVYTLALLANNDITIGAVVETYSAIGASDIDLSTANYFSKTISGATTFTVSNVASSGKVSSFILELTNGGSATVTWFSGVTWASATAPTLTTSGLDILGFYTRDGGTTWRGLVLAQAVA